MHKIFKFLTALLLISSPLHAQDLSLTVGEIQPPAQIKTVLSAGNPSDVLLLAVAPEKMAGTAGFDMSKKGKLFPVAQQQLPLLGKIAGKGSTLSPEKIVALQPQLIVDVGNVTANYQSQAKRTFEQTNVPYILLDGSLSNTPNALRQLGKLLGVENVTEPQAQYAEQTLAAAQQFAQSQPAQTFYVARNGDGLQTGQTGSIHTEALELLGLKNVVDGDQSGLVQVSMEQLLLWQPGWIFTQYDQFAQNVQSNPQWQALSAVRNQKIFVFPTAPFGWLDSPPSLNRLLGLRWLKHQFSGKAAQDFVPEIQQFYKLFYHIDLDEKQAAELLPKKL